MGGVILIDILNDKIMSEEYYAINTMQHIFSMNSLKICIEKAGGRIQFINTCCVKNPEEMFQKIELGLDNSIFKKVLLKIVNKLHISKDNVVMSYYAKATQLKYGNPEGQYIRAVIKKG